MPDSVNKQSEWRCQGPVPAQISQAVGRLLETLEEQFDAIVSAMALRTIFETAGFEKVRFVTALEVEKDGKGPFTDFFVTARRA